MSYRDRSRDNRSRRETRRDQRSRQDNRERRERTDRRYGRDTGEQYNDRHVNHDYNRPHYRQSRQDHNTRHHPNPRETPQQGRRQQSDSTFDTRTQSSQPAHCRGNWPQRDDDRDLHGGKRYQHQYTKESKADTSSTTSGDVCESLVLCAYCGDDDSSGNLYLKDNEKFHRDCHSIHLPRSKEAVEGFKSHIVSNKKVFMVAINVTYLHGFDDEQKELHKVKKAKRDKKVQELLKYVAALRNSASGSILIHLVGLKQGDKFTGPFDEFADEKLNGLIHDGKLFTDVYKKQLLSNVDELSEFHDFLVLFVAGASYLTTSDYKTKVTFDDRIIDPSPKNIDAILRERRLFSNSFHKVTEVKSLEDICNLQESRCLQFKGHFLDDTNEQRIAHHILKRLKLPQYVTAFAKLEGGGSYLYGVTERVVSKGDPGYKSKTAHPKPVAIEDRSRFRESISQSIKQTLLACDYEGNEETTDVVEVHFLPSKQDEENVVVHISVRSVSGLVFYDKLGPLAYRYDPQTNSIGRYSAKDWFMFVRTRKHHLDKSQA